MAVKRSLEQGDVPPFDQLFGANRLVGLDEPEAMRERADHPLGRDAGLPERTDRRGVIAVLTATGLNLLKTAAPNHVASVRAALVDAVEPADYEALGRAMSAVLEVAD